jgi:Coenzyme PQQ synthesis protein D (PqqD)
MTLSFARQVCVPPHVLVNEIGGESVFLHLKNERYLGLDEVGTRMWKSLTTSASIQAAYEHLLAEYDVDAEQLHQDLERLLEGLLEQGLVELRSE